MTDIEIEKECTEKGLTAPRIMMADIAANIATEYYFTADQGVRHAYLDALASDKPLDIDLHPPIHPSLTRLTFCVLILQNGFTVNGESACASPENFDEEIGRKIARQNAIQKIWPLMGYALKSRLQGEQ